MINGAHVVVYSKDAEADRAFFRDILRFASVDAGHGWLIFDLLTAESAFHPAEENDRHELYLMCDDIEATRAELEGKGATFSSPITDQALRSGTANSSSTLASPMRLGSNRLPPASTPRAVTPASQATCR